MKTRHTLPVLVLALTLPALTACAPQAESASDTTAAPVESAPSGGGHGYVAGAEELSEPATGLITLSATGLSLMDIATEETTAITVDASTLSDAVLASDGRFVLVDDGDTVTIVDSGVWTVDHGDHQHYYRAPAGAVGTVDGGDATIASSESSVVVRSAVSGDTIVLNREALGQGAVEETARIKGEPGPGAAYPVGGELLVIGPDADGADGDATVQRYSVDGDAIGDPLRCADLGVTGQTRAGIVVDCADDSVLVQDSNDGVEASRISRPDGPRPHGDLSGRALRPVLSAPAGDDGYWTINTRSGEWALTPTEEALRTVVASDDDEERVLGITEDGTLNVYVAGNVVATADASAADDAGDESSPSHTSGSADLIVDRSRAYLRTNSGISEIDYVDNARVSREFAIDALSALRQVGA
ncbi:MAG: hypothetical protein ACTJHU_02025 [Mycetocola sp.]